MSRIVGNEGLVSFGTYNITANAWSMSVSRVVSDVTAYGDTATNVRGGVPTYSGSVSGFMAFNAATTSPELDVANFATGIEAAVVLTAATGCTYTGQAVVSNVAMASNKTGDATLSFDFTFNGAPVEVWDETP